MMANTRMNAASFHKLINSKLKVEMNTAAVPHVVEVTRGDFVESRHQITVAVVDTAGSIVLQAGDIERPIYARSAIKPLQALELIEGGAADAFKLTKQEIALACASHNGEQRHIETIQSWLSRIGLSVENLRCGPHAPLLPDAADALIRAGKKPSALHNNCSGKHAGFLTLARYIDASLKGYERFEHPVQQRVLGVLEQMSGLDLQNAPRGIDGCGIPVIAIPLVNIALAMAHLAVPDDQPEPRQVAAKKICDAMASEPFLIAGTERFDTRVIEATDGCALVKSGAEGVLCAMLSELGLGIALKVADGAQRGAETAMAKVLICLGVPGIEAGDVEDLIEPKILNRRGECVGRLRAITDADRVLQIEKRNVLI